MVLFYAIIRRKNNLTREKMENWKRPEKGKARNYAMANEGRAKSKKSRTILAMPAGEQLDIREALANGNFNSNDFIIAIDNDSNVCAKIQKYLRRNFKNFKVICDDVQNVNLEEFIKSQKVLKGCKIDFSFLDLCGKLNSEIFYWLYQNRESFCDDCRFGLTVFSFDRNSKFEPIIHKHTMDSDISDELEYLLAEAKNNLTKYIQGGRNDAKDLEKGATKKKAILRAANVIKSIKASCYSFMIAMNDKDITINRLYRYKDKRHSEMVFIDFRCGGKKVGSDFAQIIIDDYDNSVCSQAQVIKRKKVKKLKKTYSKVKYIDRFNITSIKDLKSAGKKAAITRVANVEAIEKNTTVEDRTLRILNGIKSALAKRSKQAA